MILLTANILSLATNKMTSDIVIRWSGCHLTLHTTQTAPTLVYINLYKYFLFFLFFPESVTVRRLHQRLCVKIFIFIVYKSFYSFFFPKSARSDFVKLGLNSKLLLLLIQEIFTDKADLWNCLMSVSKTISVRSQEDLSWMTGLLDYISSLVIL